MGSRVRERQLGERRGAVIGGEQGGRRGALVREDESRERGREHGERWGTVIGAEQGERR